MNENLKIKVTSDSTQARRDMGGFDSKMKSTIKSVATLAAGMIALKKSFDYLRSSVNLAGQFQQWRIAFETMLGSVEKAESALRSITKFAAETPFELTGLVKSSKQLLAYGIEVENLIPTLDALGNIAAGVGKDKLPSIILAFGKIRTKGRASLEELNILLEAGVPILDQLAKNFDVTKQTLFDMVTKGKVAFDDVNRALRDMSSESGKFANLMQKQSKSYLGVVSNFGDAVDQLSIKIGSGLLPTLTKMIKSVLPMIEEWTIQIQLHETQVNYTSDAYKNLGITAKTAMLEARKETLLTALEIEKHPDIIQTMWRNTQNAINSVIKAVEKSPIAYLLLLKAVEKVGWAAKDFEIAQEKAVDPKKVKEYSDEIANIDQQLKALKGSVEDIPDINVNVNTEQFEKLRDITSWEKVLYLPVSLKFAEPTEEERESLQEHVDKLYTALPSMEITIDPEYLEEEIKQLSPLLENLKGAISGTLYDMFSGEFDNIGEMWVSFLKRMAAQYLATMLVNQLVGDSLKTAEVAKSVATGTAIASAYATAAALAATASFGAAAAAGSAGILATVALSKGLALAAHGGADFIVPSGYPNDSFPMRVESGEHVSVTPSGQRSRTDELLQILIETLEKKPVANTLIFDDVDMSRYVDRGKLRREYS
ncbi:MAG: tape measure protein [Candidatus Cloacimonetes bacterium]|nr:tape measure protein [Candidatus Cloacimonadota bacterium]